MLTANLELVFEGFLASLDPPSPGAVFRGAVVVLDDGAQCHCRLVVGHPLPCVEVGSRVEVRRFTTAGGATVAPYLTFDDMEPVYA